MNAVCDIVVVGGGPAGTTTALSLARAAPDLATRVVLLEKARYPRDKPCAGGLGARGDALLRAIGVEVDVPSVAIDGISFRGAKGEAVAVPGRIGRVVRRMEFDDALARAARARGVEVREGVRVEGVRDEGSAGAVVETSAGELRARVVVGCDGVGSIVRRALGLGAGRVRAQVVEVDTEAVPTDRDRGLLHFDASDRRLSGYAWDFPTIVDGRELVCRGVYRIRLDGSDADQPDVAALLAERLHTLGVDPARCKNKRFAERGFEPASRIAKGALMLAGEAAGVDPVTGEGIAQAIEYGILAGRFLSRRIREARDGAMRVDDWEGEVAKSRLALDLRIRTWLTRMFYGARRAELECLLTASPDALFLACRLFAAQRYDLARVASVAARGTAIWMASAIADGLRGRSRMR